MFDEREKIEITLNKENYDETLQQAYALGLTSLGSLMAHSLAFTKWIAEQKRQGHEIVALHYESNITTTLKITVLDNFGKTKPEPSLKIAYNADKQDEPQETHKPNNTQKEIVNVLIHPQKGVKETYEIIMGELGLKTWDSLINVSITLMLWAAEETMSGAHISSINPETNAITRHNHDLLKALRENFTKRHSPPKLTLVHSAPTPQQE